jgi:hypothetical protein
MPSIFAFDVDIVFLLLNCKSEVQLEKARERANMAVSFYFEDENSSIKTSSE